MASRLAAACRLLHGLHSLSCSARSGCQLPRNQLLASFPTCTQALQLRRWSAASGTPGDGDNSGSSSNPSSSSSPASSAERMVDLLAESPQMQQMMLAVMPPGMRNPEMLKQLFQDPAMRKRIADMIAQRGLAIPEHVIQRMNAQSMDDAFARATRMGLNPVDLFQKMVSYPGLLAKLKEPKVMQAFLDISENPANQLKYEGDRETLEVVLKVKEILGSSVKPAGQQAAASPSEAIQLPALDAPAPSASSTSTSTAPTSASADTAAEAAPPSEQPALASSSGSSEQPVDESSMLNPLVGLMASDPKSARWLQHPRVMQALQEVHKSPWKTVKYVFDREVMEAFKDLKTLLKGQRPSETK